jgi:hypothetical protein
VKDNKLGFLPHAVSHVKDNKLEFLPHAVSHVDESYPQG